MTGTPTVELRGLEDFTGVVHHDSTAVLDRLQDLDQKCIALTGEPASVTKLVAPLSRHAARLKVFQADGVWVIPRRLGSVPAAPLLRRAIPRGVRRHATEWAATRNLDRQIDDGWTRRQLAPPRPPTTHSVVCSDDYYRALHRSNVELITWPLAQVVPPGIRTADGLEHHVDVIVIA